MPPKGPWTEEGLMDAWCEVQDEGLSVNEAAKRTRGSTKQKTISSQRLSSEDKERLEPWVPNTITVTLDFLLPQQGALIASD
ncbi:hypothetical protein VPNG_03407 [Cytospora leucostoma]|uniref:Uncharacterized protein n=1 Tax=Cytospora leucostoma TaxID=1230097 RepID=A0A423XG04_9PEZI|nr:hypothetical protein VPNG_03407 [Cytospora leucostoma]